VKTAFSILSFVCFSAIAIYVLCSVMSALWIAPRHQGNYFHLEFAPHRARGSRELQRLKRLRRLRGIAIISLPIGLAAMFILLML
jgi:hypothetical protein